MTWVLGSGVMWGYGAVIADVRVTLPSGAYVDGLQKIHAVGPWMYAGFAGSVRFGFLMVEEMRKSFKAEREWMPEMAAHLWRRRARRAWEYAPLEEKQWGSALLLVGPSPLPSAGWPYARCVRMRSPHFELERSKEFSWLSIGTGASHELAAAYAQHDLSAFADGPGKFEVNDPGGTAITVAGNVASGLAKAPMADVSDRVLVGMVWPGRFEMTMLDARAHGGGWSSWQRCDPVGLATNWSEFQQLAQSAWQAASAAAA